MGRRGEQGCSASEASRVTKRRGDKTHTHMCRSIHIAVAGHHLMLVLYGRLTFQPACVFRGLNKGLNCVCVCGPTPPTHKTYTSHSQPTAYCSHATQPTVPSAKRSQSAPGVCRRSARVGGSGAALWAAHPHIRLGRAGRAHGVSRARRTRGSRRGRPQPGSRAAAPAGAQPPPPPRAAAGCCPAHAKKSA